jgi:fluoroacetyl-CoA thioesterase
MKNTLKVGATSRFSYKVPAEKTVPHLYPEAYEFQHMPRVFATGFMVGLMEWTCLKVLEPHLDEGEGSLGIHIDVSHIAATVPGQTVTVDAECTAVDGRRIAFNVKAHDGMVVALERFVARVNQKAKAARVTEIGNPAKVQGQHG